MKEIVSKRFQRAKVLLKLFLQNVCSLDADIEGSASNQYPQKRKNGSRPKPVTTNDDSEPSGNESEIDDDMYDEDSKCDEENESSRAPALNTRARARSAAKNSKKKEKRETEIEVLDLVPAKEVSEC